jgi:SMODS-associated and fused to various effectors sensor domain
MLEAAMSEARAPITTEASLRLWVAAGGRCEYCNSYLLADEFTGYELNLAERAHIVGASTSRGSPRGDSPLPLEARGGEANLMLLCRDHHRVIDRLIAEHTIEGLLRMKREHETRILHLTGLADDRASIVVRAIGAIRSGAVEIPRAAAAAAVIADGRFPRYPLALAGEDMEIDLRNLPDEGDPGYWSTGVRIIEQAAARLREARQPVTHLSIFALARIPFLIALGFHLDDKIPATIHQPRRDGTVGGWLADEHATPVSFAAQRRSGTPGSERVALAVSVTAAIAEDVVATAGEGASVFEIAPVGVPRGRDVLAATASLESFAETYHQLLELIEREHPACRLLEVYPACPAAAAVALGRGVMRDAQPALRVNDRAADGAFRVALELR